MTRETTPPALLLYGVQAMADHVGLRRRQAQHLIDTGVMPHFRIGRTICGNKATLTAWLLTLEARSTHKGRRVDDDEDKPRGIDDGVPKDRAA